MTLDELNSFCIKHGAPLGGDRNQWIVDRIERLEAAFRGLKELDRFGVGDTHSGCGMWPEKDGVYVRYDDVEEIVDAALRSDDEGEGNASL